MKTFFNAEHAHHEGLVEMYRGEFVPCFDVSARAERVLVEMRRRGFGTMANPPPIKDEALLRVHAPRYVDFLRDAWSSWVALDPSNAGRDALPSVWPIRQHRCDVVPHNFAAQLGLFSFDAGTPLTKGAWRAARGGAACAIAAASHVQAGARAAFALTRPPGHHAGYDFFGGYCFLNNAALAAQALRDGGAARVAVLDIDYHHGNGTQSLFYERADVVYVSVHADPRTDYPFYLGHADERGAGPGEGSNVNLPLPRGAGFDAWRKALKQALRVVANAQVDAMVVSLGVDTFEGDPISGFLLCSDDYLRVGQDLAYVRLPTVFVLEGGYAVDAIGVNVANVLEGYVACQS